MPSAAATWTHARASADDHAAYRSPPATRSARWPWRSTTCRTRSDEPPQPSTAHDDALRRSRGDLEYLATHDSLTSLPNRRQLEHEIERIISDCVAAGQPCAVVVLDLDGFKYINDSRGHAVGDHVLIQVARLFRAQLRPSDFVGRLGGDEFAATLPDVTADDAQGVVHGCWRRCGRKRSSSTSGRAVRMTASAGMAFLDPGDPQISA